MQCKIKCFSSSIAPLLQYVHNRSFKSKGGLAYRPVSIFKEELPHLMAAIDLLCCLVINGYLIYVSAVRDCLKIRYVRSLFPFTLFVSFQSAVVHSSASRAAMASRAESMLTLPFCNWIRSSSRIMLRFCHRYDGRHGFEKNISSCTVSYTALPMKTDLHFQPTLC